MLNINLFTNFTNHDPWYLLVPIRRWSQGQSCVLPQYKNSSAWSLRLLFGKHSAHGEAEESRDKDPTNGFVQKRGEYPKFAISIGEFMIPDDTS